MNVYNPEKEESNGRGNIFRYRENVELIPAYTSIGWPQYVVVEDSQFCGPLSIPGKPLVLQFPGSHFNSKLSTDIFYTLGGNKEERREKAKERIKGKILNRE